MCWRGGRSLTQHTFHAPSVVCVARLAARATSSRGALALLQVGYALAADFQARRNAAAHPRLWGPLGLLPLTRRCSPGRLRRSLLPVQMAADASAAQRAFWKTMEALMKAAFDARPVRVLELCERAFTAATTLYGADSLVVTHIHSLILGFSGSMTLQAVIATTCTDSSTLAAQHQVSNLRSAVELLQRRMAAESLLPGRCRADEVAFYRKYLTMLDRLNGVVNHNPLSLKQQLYSCLGVAALALTARRAVEFVRKIRVDGSQRVCSTVDVQLFLHFAADALELFASPASNAFSFDTALPPEPGLYMSARALAIAGPAHLDSPGCMRAFRRVMDGLEAMERSGVPQRRRYAQRHSARDAELDKNIAKAQAANAHRTPRTCALPSCGGAELHPDQFKRCAACGGVHYCCKEHQATHWPEHKAACKAARRAAAAAEGGAGPSTEA